MENNWAAENLQTIRTIMERSALYRRALAPIMIFVGAVVIIGGIIGWLMQIDSARGFVFFWAGIATVALAGAFLLVRRQALKDSELFWSPPARRVTQAALPSFFIGAFVGFFFAWENIDGGTSFFVIVGWCWLFGCALHAAGFFMSRGIKWFGWFFVITGCVLIVCFLSEFEVMQIIYLPHLIMGGIFGGLHLAYGIYLYFTEKKNPAA